MGGNAGASTLGGPTHADTGDVHKNLHTRNVQSRQAELAEQHFQSRGGAPGLAKPWQEALLPALFEMRLLAGDDVGAWEQWIAPQLAQAPFPIVSAFDVLWWLNFSCKWQQVGMRCCHDGGSALAPVFQGRGGDVLGGGCTRMEAVRGMPGSQEGRGAEATKTVSNLLGGIRHFYDDPRLELWACLPECHARKFADLGRWSSYKEPLKRFIFDFARDEEYYLHKQKVASLNHGVEGPHSSAEDVDSVLCLLVDQDETHQQRGRETHELPGGRSERGRAAEGPGDAAGVSGTPHARGDARVRGLRWGAASTSECRGLAALLARDFLDLVTGDGAGATRQVVVDPWAQGSATAPCLDGGLDRARGGSDSRGAKAIKDGSRGESMPPVCVEVSDGPLDAFARGPGAAFATEDERQRRTFNPVTAATLLGKCACLLPPALVRGKSVLDLGACLGAMCHWALLCGARKAVAVEAQPDFCVRARTMLQRAEDTWPAPGAGTHEHERFAVIEMGAKEFLAGCPAGSFDVVIAAGVLHCFVDPVSILLDMCRVANTALVIEVDQREVYLNGAVRDGDDDRPTDAGDMRHAQGMSSLARGVAPAPHASERAGLLQLAPSAMVNKSGDDASFQGLSVVPSRPLVEAVVQAMGFEPTRVRLRPHPTLNPDVRTYTGSRLHAALPRRFFLRCTRPQGNLPAIPQSVPRSLEDSVLSRKGRVHRWHHQPNATVGAAAWWMFPAAAPQDSRGDS